MKLFAIIEEGNGPIAAAMAREMLLRAAKEKNIEAEIQLRAEGTPLNIPQAQSPDDILLFLTAEKNNDKIDAQKAAADFRGSILTETRDEALNNPQNLWQKIEAQAQKVHAAALVASSATAGSGRRVGSIVAVTSCPTGIAHTFMAAEALQEGAKALNIPLRVETQGSVGAGTPLTEQEIQNADLVIIAADKDVDRRRFDGKNVYASGTRPAIANGRAYIEKAIEAAQPQKAAAKTGASADPAGGGAKKGLFYPPLMTGVSFMLPFVVAGGLLIALGLAIGGVNVAEAKGTFGNILWQIGAQGAFPLIVPVLAGYIAFAIADRPALVPGMVGGYISNQIGAGFIGGIIAGFLAGYITKAAIHYIRLPKALEGLNPVLILPLVCTAATGLIMFYIIREPTVWLLDSLTVWVQNLESHSGEAIFNAVLLGAVIGGMMAVDMGGPINKAAYTVAIGLLSVKAYMPMAAAMIGGMTPPMALALACYLRPSLFTEKERKSKEATFVMGLAFISEGAIPFASRDPLRIIPCLVIGSAFAGALALALGTGIVVPHGGIFLLPIKGAIIHYGGYFAALIGGVLVSALCLCLICRPAPRAETAETEAASA